MKRLVALFMLLALLVGIFPLGVLAAPVVDSDPDMGVWPPVLVRYLCEDSTGDLYLMIFNVGDADLTWTMSEVPPSVDWLSEDPLSGTVPPDDYQWVTVTFDSTGLAPGLHLAWLVIENNDPETPTWVVPVALTVVDGCGNNPTLHINRTKIFQHPSPPFRTKVTAQIQIVDQDDQPVAGAEVVGLWTLPDGTQIPGPSVWPVTDARGRNKFWEQNNQSGWFTFCVTNITAAGYDPWDPSDPLACMEIQVP
jgi:hypothetical protein